MTKDWVRWHQDYDVEGPLARRLAIVQRHIQDVLASRGSMPLSVLSICSGDGQDLLGPLSERLPGNGQVTGRLVELDPTLAARARRAIEDASLTGIEVVTTDAGNATAYVGAVPADLVVLCGVFGNISEADIQRTVSALPMLCAEGAAVIWTRHRRPPDLTPAIRRWFHDAGFVNEAFDTVPDSLASVGVELFRGQRGQFRPEVRLFDFLTGDSN